MFLSFSFTVSEQVALNTFRCVTALSGQACVWYVRACVCVCVCCSQIVGTYIWVYRHIVWSRCPYGDKTLVPTVKKFSFLRLKVIRQCQTVYSTLDEQKQLSHPSHICQSNIPKQ